MKNQSEKQKTQVINISKKIIGSSRHYRPLTSPYPENLLAAVKLIEKTSHRPSNSLAETYSQDKSNDRLYRGARCALDKTPEGTPNKEIPENPRELLFTENANLEFHDFLDSIRMLYPLRFDLELNYEIARGDAAISQHTMLGDYFSLEEKLENFLKTGAEDMKSISSTEILRVIQEYNRIVRHILMGLKTKDLSNEAILVEMLWRIVIKLFDNALILHERSLFDLTEMAKLKTKTTIKEYKEKMHETHENYIAAKAEFEKKQENMQQHIKTLQESINEKDEYIKERDRKMSELVEVSNRDKSCIEMARILKKLNTYIGEAEDQQHKQVAALTGISYVMSLAEKFDDKPKSEVHETQTELSIPYNPYPELERPILSKTFFYYLYEKETEETDFEAVEQNLISVLDECAGEESFLMRYGGFLLRNNKGKSEIVKEIKAAGAMALKDNSVKCRLFYRLLGLPVPLDLQFELGLLKINQFLCNIDGRTQEQYLPLYKIIDVFQLILPGNHLQIEQLLSSLSYITNFHIEMKKSTWILLARFYFALEKTKKPFKFHLEALDTKKEGIIQSSAMIEWIRAKLNLWMKESEILTIIDFFGGEIMKISNILEKFTAAKLEKCREIFVSKEEILIFFIEDWEKLQSSQIDRCEVLKTFNNFQEFQAEVSSYGKNIAEEELKKAFFELIIRKDLRKVLRKYEFIDRVGFSVDEIKRYEKKMLKKHKSVAVKQQKT